MGKHKVSACWWYSICLHFKIQTYIPLYLMMNTFDQWHFFPKPINVTRGHYSDLFACFHSGNCSGWDCCRICLQIMLLCPLGKWRMGKFFIEQVNLDYLTDSRAEELVGIVKSEIKLWDQRSNCEITDPVMKSEIWLWNQKSNCEIRHRIVKSDIKLWNQKLNCQIRD